MHHRTRTAILLVIVLTIMSGLYIFNKLADVPAELDEQPTVPFDGKVPLEISLGDASKKQVIFTFDAGSGTTSVVPILAALDKHDVKGTFFITGKWALQNPELARMIADDGHEIFNHSYDHPHLPELSDEDVTSQLTNTDDVLMSITGSSTKPYFRPPYGDRDERVLKLAAQVGYQSVYWTIDALDWQENEGVTADDVKYTIFSNLQPGMIVLMHVGDTITGSILDEVLTIIEEKGYRAVSLTQSL
jgi:peptidoglycan/xylan/chitin deacetylase (PgdA/CDA1 family)